MSSSGAAPAGYPSAEDGDVAASSGQRSAHAWIEPVFWFLVALALACAMRFFAPMPISADGYAYMDTAGNIAQRREIATSLVYYDQERSHGVMPAPMTWYAPAYPAVIAGLSGAMTYETAARAVSAVAFAATASVVLVGLVALGAPLLVRIAILVLYVCNVTNLLYSSAVLSDMMFQAVATAGLVAVIAFEKHQADARRRVWLAALAGCFFGVAYWTRYAGLFFIAAFVVYASVRSVFARTRASLELAASACIPVLFAGSLMARNLYLVGDWKGGNAKPSGHDLRFVVTEYVQTHGNIFGARRLGLLLAIVLVSVLIFAWRRRASRIAGLPVLRSAAALTGIVAALYTSGLAYACMHSPADFNERMFLPLLPAYLFMGAIGIIAVLFRSPSTRRVVATTLMSIVVVYVLGNVRTLALTVQRAPAQHLVVAARLAKPMVDGRPLLNWVQANIPKTETIVAADPFATGWSLERPTVGLAKSRYSAVRWDCGTVAQTMARFHARYLLVYTGSGTAADPLVKESRFVRDVVAGQSPCGFSVAAENAEFRVLALPGGTIATDPARQAQEARPLALRPR